MAVVWLIRHAATDENLRYQMIGITDVSLGTTGMEQARALAQRLKSVKFEAIYTSPLVRARETATLIATENKHFPSIQLQDELKELHLGQFEGASSFQAYEQFQSIMDKALDSSTDDFAFPGGEWRSTAVKRFNRALWKIVLQHPDGHICVVTHGAVIGLWLSFLHKVPLGRFRDYQPQHAAITTVLAGSLHVQFRLLSLNETGHLSVSK